METAYRQIFQTNHPGRWNRVKWTLRILLAIALFFLIIFFIALINATNPSLPRLRDKNEVYKRILNPNDPTTFITRKNLKLQSFQQFIQQQHKLRQAHSNKTHHEKKALIPTQQIRAAFYVPWDAQSFFSLKNNAGKLNMIFPEWIFLTPSDTLQTRIDPAALKIMRDSSLHILPILSNHFNDDFDGKSVHRLLHQAGLRKRIIHQLKQLLIQNHFAGVNIDFENLIENNNDALVAFQRQLYDSLHPAGLLVTIDVPPFNEDYDYGRLAEVSDYLVVMAYDEHNDQSMPGPISDQHWIEGALDAIGNQVPSEKIILGLASYGYDWPEQSQAANLTYQEALSLAKEHHAQIQFDNDSYNLHYSYFDDDSVKHDVYFTDAATNFNTMRFAAEDDLAGVCFWRLGSEDNRLWNFYTRDLSDSAIALKPIDFSKFSSVTLSNDVDYLGEGEILDVLATPEAGKIELKIDTPDMLIAEQHYVTLPSTFVIRQFGAAQKKLVLTFDDGPDPRYTPRILDILEKEHVPAAFFLVGINAENNIPLVKREFRDGFEIGDHTFTHPNIAALPPKLAIYEIQATRLLIECITGHSTILFRAPYNADSEPHLMVELIPVALARKLNYYTIGENIDPEDWDVEDGVNADTIFNRVVRMQDRGNIILLHDAGGNREATVEALPRIIHYFKAHGYQFTTVGDLMGKTREQLMPPIKNKRDYYLIKLNYFFATCTYWINNLLWALFMVGIVLSLGRIVFMAILAWKESRREKLIPHSLPEASKPLVSVIIPAYNEEVNIVRTIRTILNNDYRPLEIICVDDGSTDNTLKVMEASFASHPLVHIYTKPNGGKASALNYGIAHAAGDFVVCIDADTQLKTDAITALMNMFTDERVGAVAGNVKVGNEVNILTRWQSIEYITSQNFDRRAFDLLNCITVVPGAIGAFRKSAILDAGGFTSDTLAEDCDLTIRILRKGYRIRHCAEAISYTEAPETWKMLFKQRFRWCFGIMQSFWKNRDACFNSHYGSLGWIALPNILIFQILLPLLAPLADIILLFGLIFLNVASKIHILEYYLIFLMVDAAAAWLAFAFEKANYRKLVWVIPQRFIYRVFMYVVVIKAIKKAIKGELQHWGALKRTGNVQIAPAANIPA
ncbi:MAG: glycosyltransferase [Thermoflavifilum sp.]|nr:glycosyltransferase [Thermoflavifilum sp.]